MTYRTYAYFALWPDLLFGAAHREVAGLGQHVHRFRHLRIVRHDKDPVSHHPAVSRRDDVESQLELDERAVSIDHGRGDLVPRIGRNEITKSPEHRIGDLEFFRLQIVTEVDAAGDLARLETTNPAIHELARERKSRTQ